MEEGMEEGNDCIGLQEVLFSGDKLVKLSSLCRQNLLLIACVMFCWLISTLATHAQDDAEIRNA